MSGILIIGLGLLAVALSFSAAVGVGVGLRRRRSSRDRLTLDLALALVREDWGLQLLDTHVQRTERWWVDTDPAELREIDRALTMWDLVARYAALGCVERQAVIDLFPGRIVDTWEQAFAYVAERRIEQPGAWASLAELYVDAYDAVHSGADGGIPAQPRAAQPRAAPPPVAPVAPVLVPSSLASSPTAVSWPVKPEPAVTKPEPTLEPEPTATQPEPEPEPAVTEPPAEPDPVTPAAEPVVGSSEDLWFAGGSAAILDVDIAVAPSPDRRLVNLRAALARLDSPAGSVGPRPEQTRHWFEDRQDAPPHEQVIDLVTLPTANKSHRPG